LRKEEAIISILVGGITGATVLQPKRAWFL
jgi:hypothetical protein